MGNLATVHYEERISWHQPFASYLADGFRTKGIPVKGTSSRVRVGGMPILLGTTFWKDIEQDGGEYILVDRCQYGDTNNWVSLAKNGRGFRAQWPERRSPERWTKYNQPLLPWRKGGSKVVLCGQVGSYSPDWQDEDHWYAAVKKDCTHFRPHPNGSNPTDLPVISDWKDVKCAVVLNSSIAVQTVMCGIPTITMDKGSMAWPVTGHAIGEITTPDREDWARFLSWCQWSHEEIKQGTPWDFLSL
jgi:hypothetical protein